MGKIVKMHNEISLEQLVNFEEFNNFKLPKLYRNFLLTYNGGRVEPNVFYISPDEGESALNVFYGIGDMQYNLQKKFGFFDEILEIGFIPIACDSGGNQICLGMQGEFYDQVFCWIHDEEYEDIFDNMYFLAKNINEFIDNLYEG